MCYLPDDLVFQNKLGMLTRSAGVEFQPCKNDTEAFKFAQREEKTFFLFIDSRKSAFIHEFAQHFSHCKLVIVLFETFPTQCDKIFAEKNIECFVWAPEREFDVRELILLLKGSSSQKHWALENQLSFPAIYENHCVINLEKKAQVISKLQDFVLRICDTPSKSQQYTQQIIELADELLPNNLINKQQFKIKWGYDADLFGLSVCDNIGQFKKQDFFQFLQKKSNSILLSSAVEKIKRSEMYFEKAHHYIANVQENKFTEVACLLRLDTDLQTFDRRLKSFHYYNTED